MLVRTYNLVVPLLRIPPLKFWFFQVRAAGKVRDTAVSRGNFKPSRRYKREIRDNGAGNRRKGTYQRVEDEKGSS